MKNIVLSLSLLALMISCKSNTEEPASTSIDAETVVATNDAYISFGERIVGENAISEKEMASLYAGLKPGDTVPVKFVARVNEVCQNKGCWMKMDLGKEEAMVKFKDYGFFMPKNLSGRQVVVNGHAYIEEMSVEDQRHFAEDAGKTKEEVAAITAPKRTLAFISDGVLIID